MYMPRHNMYMPTPVCRARAYRVANKSDLTSPSAFMKSPASGADSSVDEAPWQNSSDFFDFLFLFDFQMSESKHFLLNLPQSPPFHQNLAPKLPISHRFRPPNYP